MVFIVTVKTFQFGGGIIDSILAALGIQNPEKNWTFNQDWAYFTVFLFSISSLSENHFLKKRLYAYLMEDCSYFALNFSADSSKKKGVMQLMVRGFEFT